MNTVSVSQKSQTTQYYSLKVDIEKRPHGKMRSTLETGGDFFIPKKRTSLQSL